MLIKQGDLASKVFYVESGEFESARIRKIKPLAVKTTSDYQELLGDKRMQKF